MKTMEIARSRGLRRGSRIIMQCGCLWIVGRQNNFHQRTCEQYKAARGRFESTRWWRRKKFSPNRRRAYSEFFRAVRLPKPSQLLPPPRPLWKCAQCGERWLGRRYLKTPPKTCRHGHLYGIVKPPRVNHGKETRGLWKKRGRPKPGRVPQEVIDRVRELYAKEGKEPSPGKRRHWSLHRVALEVGWSETTVKRILDGQSTPARLCVCLRCGNRWYTQLAPPTLPRQCPTKSGGSNGCGSFQWNTPRLSKQEWARRISEGQKRVIRQRMAAGLPPRKTDPWRDVTPEQRQQWLDKGRQRRRENRERRARGERVPYMREVRAARLKGVAPSRILQRKGEQRPTGGRHTPFPVELVPMAEPPRAPPAPVSPPTVVLEGPATPIGSVRALAARLSAPPAPRRLLPPHPDNPRCGCRPCREARGLPPLTVAPIGGA